MKFLLKKQIRRKKINNTVQVYPGNPGFIRLAKKSGIQYECIKTQHGEFLVTDLYLFSKNDYNNLFEKFKNQIDERREKFWKQDPLIQLVKIIQYIFERNNKAKANHKYSAIQNAYDDKNQFLEIALDIAGNLSYPFFMYGYDEDPWNDYHHYIYYFEIEGLGQVSFHSEKLFPSVPEFPGKWIGYRNEKFRFHLKDVKKLIRGVRD